MTVKKVKLNFTANKIEYFKIYFISLILSICTFGIYSPWAYVRKNNYIIQNIRLKNNNLKYHVSPYSILKGRLFVFIIALLYLTSPKIIGTIGFYILTMLLILLIPWFIVSSLKFFYRNISYRDNFFSFTGGKVQAFFLIELFPYINFITIFLLYPFIKKEQIKYYVNNLKFGDKNFKFSGSISDIFLILLNSIKTLIPAVFSLAIIYFIFHDDTNQIELLKALSFILFLYFMIFSHTYISTKLQNLFWNKTSVGEICFSSNLKTRKLLLISFSNLILKIFTLGLYSPIAKIRKMKYQIESIEIILNKETDLEQFKHVTNEKVSDYLSTSSDLENIYLHY